uniref:RRM domain-containing protein n=1 Tax=Sus scrofa TaxID=9823 RepID=A0A8D0JLX4_PIG
MGATAADRDLDLQAPPHLKGQDYSPTAAAAQLPVAVSTAGIGRPHVSLPLLLPASSELREHFAQLGYVIQCTVPFHKEIDFPRGTAWIQCPSGELPTALQQENHVINGVKLHVQAQNAKALQEDQTSDKEKDFETSMAYESRQNGEFPV